MNWDEAALATRRFADSQPGPLNSLRAVSTAVADLVDGLGPPEAFVRSGYRRLRTGPYRVEYEVDAGTIIVIRVDRLPSPEA